ncbi:MAG: translocation/assembly module TamB domain-containing protein [Bryobacteraceae bacterium]|nr:translocation/assembly module TamB domain-containing protein [Bryobacteraceae bacterium]
MKLIAGAIVGVLVLVLILLHTAPVQSRVLEAVQSYLRTNYDIELRAEGFGYNLLTLTIELTGASLRAAHNTSAPPFLEMDAAHVDLAFPRFWSGEYRIDDARLVRPRINLILAEGDQGNLPRIPASPEEQAEGATKILLTSGSVGRASFRLEDRTNQLLLELPNWSIGVMGSAGDFTHAMHFQTDAPGRLTWEGESVPIQRLEMDSQWELDSMILDRLFLQAGQTEILARGKWPGFEELDLTASVELALAEAARMAKVSEPVEGRARAEATVQGPLDNLRIAGNINVSQVAVRGLRDLSLVADAALADGRLRLDSMQVTSPMGAITGAGDLALAEGKGESRIEARVERLRLQPLTRELDSPVMVASALSGTLQATMNELDWRTAAGTANLRLEASGPVAKDTLPVAGTLLVEGRNQDFTAEIRQLSALGSTVNGVIRLRDLKGLSGQVRASAGDLERLSSELNAFLQTDAAPPLGGSLELTADLGGAIEAPRAAVRLASSNLSVHDLHDITLRAAADYSPDKVDLRELRLEWQGQAVTAAGNVGLKGDSPELNIDAQVAQASIADILRGLGQDVPVEGTFDLTAQIRGTANEPAGQASLQTGPLSAYGEPFQGLTAQAQLAGQQLELTLLELRKESGRLAATGRYGLDTRAYEVEAAADGLELTGLSLPDQPPIRGVLHLNASGAGSVDDPSLEANLKLASVQFGERDLGDIAADARVENRQAVVRLNAPGFALAADAAIGTEAPYPVEFTLEAKGTDLAQFQVELGEGRALTGTVTAQAKGSGELSNWENGTAGVSVSDLDLEVEGQRISNVGPLELRYDKGILEVQSAQIATGDSRLRASGSLPIETEDPARSIQAEGELSLPALAAFAPQLSEVVAEGVLQLSAEVRGTLRQPVPTGALRTEGAFIQHPSLLDPIEDIRLDVSYQDDRLDLRQLSARLGDAAIRAQGVVPLDEGEAKLEADVENLELTSFTAMPEAVTSRISFRIEAQSPRAQDLTAARATIAFSELSIGYGDMRLEQEAPARIVVEGGMARIESLRLSGPDSLLEASGAAGLESPYKLDLTAKGNLDAAILSLFAEDVHAEGESRFEIAARGTAEKPEVTGFFELQDGQIAVASPEIVAEELNLRLEMSSGRIAIASLKGMLNGGELSGSGFAEYSAKGPGKVDLNIRAKDAFFNIPSGLRTQVQADVRIHNVENAIEIAGKVQIAEGAYREPLDPQTQIFQALRSSGVELVEEQNPVLQRIRFNLQVATIEPLLVENNLMQMAVNANVRLVGTYYRPGLLGRVSIEEGGQLYLNERRYFLERGELAFVDQRDIKPDLDILATTRVSNYDITLHLTGGAEDYSASFTSEPYLDQPDIVSLLLTGRKLEQVSGQETNIARDQALSLVTGAAASRLSAGAQRTLGLSEVRIEPTLISPESDPGARLTVAQNLTDFLRFVYSMNLRNSSDQIQILEWDVTRRFLARSTRQDDNTYRFDLNHSLTFGGRRDPEAERRRRERREIGAVRFEGNAAFSEKELADKLGLKPGGDYSFFRIHRRLENLRDFYRDQGYLEARVRTSRNMRDRIVDLTVTVREGPKVQFVFEGYEIGRRGRNNVRRAWREGFVDAQRLRESTDVIRNELAEKGYIQPELSHEVRVASGVKRVLFEIQPGVRYRNVELAFEGASATRPSELRSLLDRADLLERIHTNPRQVSSFLTRYYQQEGYLSVKVQEPRYDVNANSRTARIVVEISEGPLFTINALRFEGNENLSALGLENALPIAAGDPYRLRNVRDSLNAVEEAYWAEGFNDAEVNYRVDRNEARGTVDLAYVIQENQLEVVKEVTVEGNDQTSENMIRTQLAIRTDEPLDYRKANLSRRNLYDTGAFALIDIQKRPLGEPADGGLIAPVALDVRIREVRPHNFRYGASYDTERGPGIILDYINRNSLGAARTLGFRSRYDSEFRELRTYFTQPLLRRFPVRTTFAGFGSRQIQEVFITDRTGFSLQQETRPWESTLFSYGYRFERTHTFDRDPDSVFQLAPFNVAPLTFSYSRDTRDEILDASRGSMFSHAIDYAPELLGSDIRFMRYFGQYFRYIPLAAPSEIPMARGLMRTRLVYAGGVRVGLGRGLGGQDLVRTERFFAGGSTTLRGFEREGVGPRDGVGPTGGNAMFVVNNEIRFPLFSIFDGVGFMDLGNVYRHVSDFDPTNLRKSTGLGLRIRTPYFLLRMDFGFVLGQRQRPDEPRSGFYFAIGQAF